MSRGIDAAPRWYAYHASRHGVVADRVRSGQSAWNGGRRWDTPPHTSRSPRTRCPSGITTPSSASSSIGASTRCRRGLRSAETSGSMSRALAGSTCSATTRTRSGTRTRCASKALPRSSIMSTRTAREFRYDELAPLFSEASRDFDADAWMSLFGRVGARYVVFTTKHHDGFALWPSAARARVGPAPTGWDRDLVGEIVTAARRHGLRAGLYYSGGLDWTFEERPVPGVHGRLLDDRAGPEFVEYASAHWHELIERYRAVDPVERHRQPSGDGPGHALRGLLRAHPRRARQRSVGARSCPTTCPARESSSTPPPRGTSTTRRPSMRRTTD